MLKNKNKNKLSSEITQEQIKLLSRASNMPYFDAGAPSLQRS